RKNLQSLDRRADSDRAFHAANRAVAARAAQRFRNLGREFNRAAMARAVPHHPQGLSRYHLVITYLRPLRTFIPWWSVAALSVPSGRWLFQHTSFPVSGRNSLSTTLKRVAPRASTSLR